MILFRTRRALVDARLRHPSRLTKAATHNKYHVHTAFSITHHSQSLQAVSPNNPRLSPSWRYLSNKASNDHEPLIITDAALKRIKEIQFQDNNPRVYLRLKVDSGGCHGFLTSFEIDDTKPIDDDIVIEKDGVKIVLDSLTLQYAKGSTIDYVDELFKSEFIVFANPNAASSCGCHVSFSVK